MIKTAIDEYNSEIQRQISMMNEENAARFIKIESKIEEILLKLDEIKNKDMVVNENELDVQSKEDLAKIDKEFQDDQILVEVSSLMRSIAKCVKARPNRKKKEIYTPSNQATRKTPVNVEEEIIDADQVLVRVNKVSPLQDYPGKSKLLPYQAAALDSFFDKFSYLEDVFSSDNVILERSHINKIITNQYLANVHVDAFAIIVGRKSVANPGMYRTFSYVSPMLWVYSSFQSTKDYCHRYVEHITAQNVSGAMYIIMPVIHEQHWILLTGHILERKWFMFDSLPNPKRKALMAKPIKCLADHTHSAFTTDITQWDAVVVQNIPRQTNSVDCGMFVLKYMENILRVINMDWSECMNWQADMDLFRCLLIYDIFNESLL